MYAYLADEIALKMQTYTVSDAYNRHSTETFG